MDNQTVNYDETIAEFCLMDDAFMTKVFEDNIPCTELLLQIILQDDTIKVKTTKTQSLQKNLQGHDVILDILAEKKDGTLFNVEVQNRSEGAVPQRARYHASVLDTNNLPSGEKYKDLPDTYVIFITQTDILRGGLPIYHIKRTIEENGNTFGDGSQIIYVNNQIKNNTPLGLLMHDFSCKEPEKMHYKVLAERAAYFKETKGGRLEMSGAMEKLMEKVNHERNVEVAKNMLAEGMSIEVVTRISKLTLEEVRALAQKQSA